MVLVLVCAMIPAAFAAGSSDLDDLFGYYLCYQVTKGKHEPVSDGTGGTVCYYCGTRLTTGSGNISGHSHAYSYVDSTRHQLVCYTYGSSCPYYGLTSAHTYNSSGYCSECGYYYYGTSSHNHQYSQVSGTSGSSYHYVAPCYNSACEYCNGGYEAHTYSDGGYCIYCGYNGYGTGTTGNLQWSNGSNYCNGDYSYPYTAHNPVYYYTSGGYTYYRCSNCSATATVYGAGTGTGTGDYAVGTYGKLYVTGYDSMTNDTYSLNESVTLSVSPSMWESGADTTNNYDFYYSWSGDVYTYSSGATAYLDTSKSSATAYCTVTAYAKGNTTTAVDSATVYWSANAVAGDDIYYTALSGQNVVLDEDDFEDFWAEQYPYGALNYVRFTGVSSGNLYDNYSGGTSLRTDVRSRGSSCYLNPSTSQIGLDDLTYVPSTYSSTGTVTIQFTAYGTSNYSYGSAWGSSYGNTSLSGTITILYTAKEVTPITYSVTANSVTLDGDDFITKYKEVMNVTYAGNLSIQFLEAPTYGTLSLNYGSGYYYQGSNIKLTDTNIGNYSFSTSSTATYSIDDLTYTPGTADDSIRFTCYSGSTLKFVGTVSFGASDPIEIELTSTGNAVTFKSSDFYNSSNTGLLTSSYVTFGTPSSGTLYKNYSNGTGTKVSTYDTFSITAATGTSSLNNITFVPYANYVGVVEIPFYMYTIQGSQVKGTVKVYVGRAFTDTAGSGYTWAVPYISKLSAQGIVSGKTSTTFGPDDSVKYGEALKLIMMAVGYPDQAKTGTHWASGFLTKAYADGLVNSANIDLEQVADRETIAAITAKALKLGYAYSINAGVAKPSDTTNGYVYALYNAGIVGGSYVGTTNYFYGSSSIKRSEICKIICNVMEYEA